jgi:hypothetical protein
MYRRLEPKPAKIEAKDSKSEEECKCTCGTEKAVDGEKKPAANYTNNYLNEHFIING